MGKIKLFLRASTLVEVITAFLVISLVFGLAGVIYLRILNSSVSMQREQANSLLRSVWAVNLHEGITGDSEEKISGWTIKTSVSPYRDRKDLQLVLLEALHPTGIKMAELKHIVYVPVAE
jgi:hypothetical protein